MNKLPPLTWLRAFEAAARKGSFKSASEELHVSPSTISHQVRDLEKLLGYPLFSRHGTGIALTKEGSRYLPPLVTAFELLRSAGQKRTESVAAFSIGAFPFLANEVLTPRLAELKSRLGTSVNLRTRTELELLSHVDPANRLDAIVRYDRPAGFPGYLSEPLFNVQLVPIVRADAPAIESPAALLSHDLIHVLGPFEGWDRWLERYAPESAVPEYAVETDSFHAAALAVSRGEGVSLGITPFINPWVSEGRIRVLSEFSIGIETGACLVYGHHNHGNPAISEFGNWLRELLA